MMRKTLAALVLFPLLFWPPASGAQEIPSSERSRKAASRAETALRGDLARKKVQWGAPLYLRIFKADRELEVWLKDGDSYRLFKTYRICTYGWGNLGPKLQQGDGQAPEGFYFVTPGRMNPFSAYHLAFNLGYPNAYDRAHGRTGAALMVHGDCCSIGCYAMTDRGIEEIYALVEAALRGGQPFFRVHIFPFRMTRENMEKTRGSRWSPFWENLKEGYDFFENNGHRPPNVEVRNGRYRFEPTDP